MALAFHSSVAKGLKLKVRKLWVLIPTLEKLEGDNQSEASPSSWIGLKIGWSRNLDRCLSTLSLHKGRNISSMNRRTRTKLSGTDVKWIRKSKDNKYSIIEELSARSKDVFESLWRSVMEIFAKKLHDICLIQKQPPEMFCKKDVFKYFAKITGNTSARASFLTKL